MKNLSLFKSEHSSCHIFPALISFIFCLFGSMTVQAQGDLLLNPKRVIFDGQKRSQEINLANIGKDTARYVISFIQIRMTEDGSFQEISQPDSGQFFSSKYLRIYPRMVTLAPNEAQVVKVQLSGNNNPAPGEYRSHLYFRAMPKEAPLDEKSKTSESPALSIRLTPVYGISIPIIIRSGASTTKSSLNNLSLERLAGKPATLKMTIYRSGNRSVYGDIAVDHVSSEGKVTRVGLVKGLSVYTPTNKRDVQVTLRGLTSQSGKLQVSYNAPADEKPERFAAAEFILN